MFEQMIEDWFSEYTPDYNEFIKAMLQDDRKAMNVYMNRVALTTFGFFDTGKRPSEAAEPERFYHGFVLGLMVDLADRYIITSNRESGFGRYDVMLELLNSKDDAIILEFKVHDTEDEKTMQDTVKAAKPQERGNSKKLKHLALAANIRYNRRRFPLRDVPQRALKKHRMIFFNFHVD